MARRYRDPGIARKGLLRPLRKGLKRPLKAL